MLVASLCKLGEVLSNPETNHDLQVDSSNILAQDKPSLIKVSTSNIWKKIMFKITMFFSKT